MRETLARLCDRQLGPGLDPYVVGACPFAHRKRRGGQHPGIEGRKVFYYRARHVPGRDLLPPSDSPVSDWAWLSRGELPSHLEEGEWRAVRSGIPLDLVGE
ncbi:unnamed protein product [Prorocentrum cordatum]|uniref:Ribosomal protein L46 N-terminal domain-containing protein n=1 Tax=Prorocentrum cordatum TaxID=2364126 RepID=A0ABN9VV19_9DINO|nr:unnamed protein product [Polarella glacialis]